MINSIQYLLKHTNSENNLHLIPNMYKNMMGHSSIDPNNDHNNQNDDENDEFDLPNVPEDPEVPEPSGSNHANANNNKHDDSGSTLFILKQIITLLKLSVQTSSKVVTPAITQLIQSVIPSLSYYYHQFAPARLKEWLTIVTSALQNIFNILSQTPQGIDLLQQMSTISAHSIHLFTSANTRQAIVEGMGMQVKAIEALRTPQMKAFLSSLPVFYIRILDILSSGEAKLLCHSAASLLWSAIDLLGQDETILALAEITALLVNALEKEREAFGEGAWNRKRNRNRGSKRRRVQLGLGRLHTGTNQKGRSSASAAAFNSKRRQERNRFMRQTYTDRLVLNDLDRSCRYGDDDVSDDAVEDAILSSLGDGTRSGNDKNPLAWLTSMGRAGDNGEGEGDDAASLPSKVVLPRVGSHDDMTVESMHLDDLDITSQDNRDIETSLAEGVNLSRLRDGIQKRRQMVNKSDFRKNMNPAKKASIDEMEGVAKHDHDHNHVHSALSTEHSFLESDAIEDLVFDTATSKDSTKTPKSPLRPRESSNKKNTRNLTLEDDDDESDWVNMDDPEEPKVQDDSVPRGTYSSVAHFYRALDDIHIKLRNDAIDTSLNGSSSIPQKDGDGQPGVSSTKFGVKKWHPRAAAAAGAGNERGQNLLSSKRKTLKGYSRMASQPTRFRPIFEQEHENDESDYKKEATLLDVANVLMKAIPRKRKMFLGGIIIVFALMAVVWTCLGCYGLYFLLLQHYRSDVGPSTTIPKQMQENEIILRILHEPAVQQIIDQREIAAAAARAIEDELHKGYKGMLLEEDVDNGKSDIVAKSQANSNTEF